MHRINETVLISEEQEQSSHSAVQNEDSTEKKEKVLQEEKSIEDQENRDDILQTESSTHVIEDVANVLNEYPNIIAEAQSVEQSDCTDVHGVKETSEIDIEMTATASAAENDNNEVAIDSAIEDTNEIQSDQLEHLPTQNDETIETSDAKSEEAPTDACVDFLDLLRENEDLFRTSDDNTSEQQKPDELPNEINDVDIASPLEAVESVEAVETIETIETDENEGFDDGENIPEEVTAAEEFAPEVIEPAEKPAEEAEGEEASEKMAEQAAAAKEISEETIDKETAGEAAAEGGQEVEPMTLDDENANSRKECLNIDCLKKSDIFHEAPDFVVNHFHLNKRQKILFVCEYCYDIVIEAYGNIPMSKM